MRIIATAVPLLGSAFQVFASTTTVTTTNDNGPGSLRQAIQDANTGDIIDFVVSGTITLTNGELVISNNLTLVGPGATQLVISGNHTSRIFQIGSNSLVGISGLTLSEGRAARGSPGPDSATPGGSGDNGGAILNEGRLTLQLCNLTNNHAGAGGYGYSYFEFGSGPVAGRFGQGGSGGMGGAIHNCGELVVVQCAFRANAAGDGGYGGVPNSYGQIAAGGNGGSGGSGGAIHNVGSMEVTESEFTGNRPGAGGDGGWGGPSAGGNGGDGGQGGNGGAIFGGGTNYISNCRFTGNLSGIGGRGGSAPYDGSRGGTGGDGGLGGAISLTGTADINFCGFFGNQATSGGAGGASKRDYGSLGGRGGDGGAMWVSGTLSATNCKLATNQAGSGGYNGYPSDYSGYLFPAGQTPGGGSGGGIFCSGNVVLKNCTLSSNLAGRGADGTGGANPGYGAGGANGGDGGQGGGLFASPTATALVISCTFGGNKGGDGGNGGNGSAPVLAQGGGGGAGGGGGGICGSGTVVVRNSTLASNSGGMGGAGGDGNNATSTYGGDGGAGGSGGGILQKTNQSDITLSGTLIAMNSSGLGGAGGAGQIPGAVGTAGDGQDVSALVVSQGYNFISQTNGSIGWVDHDMLGSAALPLNPMLGPLTNNGGPTPTMALLPGSPAIDQGISTGLNSDQRGRPRPYDNPAVINASGGDGSDVGAFELQSPAAVFTDIRHEGSNVWLHLLTEVGWNYRVERSDSLPGTNWTTVADDLPGTGATAKLVDPTVVNSPMRFYRAVTVP